MLYLSSLFFILFSLTAWSQNIEIKSNPEDVDIYLVIDENKAPLKIGKTPFKQSLKELITTYVKKNSFIVELKKEGYEPYRVLFAKGSDVDIELSVNLEISGAIKTIKKHDLLIGQLFEVQRHIRSKNFKDALIKLEALEKEFQYFSTIPELKAITYYMNKDIEKALANYRRAFALNSDNTDAYKMKVYLEKKMGIDTEIK